MEKVEAVTVRAKIKEMVHRATLCATGHDGAKGAHLEPHISLSLYLILLDNLTLLDNLKADTGLKSVDEIGQKALENCCQWISGTLPA